MKDTKLIKEIWSGDHPQEESWIKCWVRHAYEAKDGTNEHLYEKDLKLEGLLASVLEIPEFIKIFINENIKEDCDYFRFIE